MIAAPTQGNTCAVIVTYHPDEGFPDRLGRVLQQFSSAIVVDNDSQAAILPGNRGDLQNVHLVLNHTNLGIAAALNQGVRLATQLGFQWVVTLDQDTVVAADMLATLLDVYQKSGGGKVIIGSNYLDANRKRNYVQCADSAMDYQERKTLITSGTLVSLSVFENIGFFLEDYFIDSVDHEFCLRARAYGYRILISCQPVMEHSIGSSVENPSRLRQFMSFNHSPTRKYFIARNTIATVKSYFLREPMWCMRQGWRLLSDFASIILFEGEKPRKMTAFVVGAIHGMVGKMGPIEKAWPNGYR